MSLRLGLLLPLAGVAALILACGGDPDVVLDDSSPSPTEAASSSPLSTSTGTFEPSPGSGTSISTPTPAATATPVATVDVTPVAEPFEIGVSAANSGLRVRETPSTTGTILGAIFLGDIATVLGEARGEEAEAGGGDLWYQVELTQDGVTVDGFVYAPLVEKVE